MKPGALFLLALPFAAQAQTPPVTCTAATISGTRGLTLTGRNIASNAVLSKVYVAVGTATFDGVGAVTFNLINQTNSSSSATQTLSGTYTLPSNCLGTVTITTGDAASFILIPYNKGLNFSLTGQDATYSFTGTGTPQPDACVNATVSGAYTFSGNGYSLSSGAIGGVNTISGLLNFDGAGGVNGSWSVATNGAAAADTITGHYSVAAGSCGASATLTDPNNNAFTLNIAMTTADGANFVMNGASSSILFTGNGHSTFTNPGLAIENAAGIPGGTPPGSLFSVYGYGMAVGKAQATNPNWPTTLASAQVTVNGELAPLYYADNAALGAEGLINAQMPLDIQPGVATVVVKNGNVVSNAAAITVPAAANPGVLIYGANHAAAQNFPSYSLNSEATPAKVGDTIIVYFTGGGAVQGQSQITTGHPTPSTSGGFPLLATPNASATIAGQTAAIEYIGLTPTLIGVYQANLVVPKIAAGDHNLVITIGGVASNVTVVSTN